MATAVGTTLIDSQELANLFKVKRESILAWIRRNPKFPKPIRISTRCLRWRLAEVERFLNRGIDK